MIERLLSTFPYMVGYLALLFFLAAVVGLWIWWEDRRCDHVLGRVTGTKTLEDGWVVAHQECLKCRREVLWLGTSPRCGVFESDNRRFKPIRRRYRKIPFDPEIGWPFPFVAPFNMDENQP